LLPDPAAIIDNNGTFLAITPSMSTVTGITPEELVGTNFMTNETIMPGSKSKLAENLMKRMSGGSVDPYEVEIMTRKGKKVTFELNAIKIEYEGNPADMIVFRDLTEKNRLIKSLDQERHRFQDVAESTGDWIWEVNLDGNYVYSNSVVEKILGYTTEEIMNQKCCDLLCKDDRTQTELELALSAQKKSFAFTKQCQHKDGHISILESQGVAAYDEEGKFIGYRGVDRDVTERKKMEEKLLKSERLAAIGGLATMVAHDLRNPLQGISYATHYIKKSTEKSGNEKMAAMLQLIDDDIKYSEKIIRDLLDFSAEYKLEFVETDPKSLVCRILTGLVVPEKVRVIDATQDEPKIYVDTSRLKRVIVNLVSNAFDA